MFYNVQIYLKNIFETTMYPHKFGKKLPPHDLRSSYATALNERDLKQNTGLKQDLCPGFSRHIE